jgi:hypothetical protein
MPEEIEEYERLSREQEAAIIDGDKVVPADLPRAAPRSSGRWARRDPAAGKGLRGPRENGARLPGAAPGFRESGEPPWRCARDA